MATSCGTSAQRTGAPSTSSGRRISDVAEVDPGPLDPYLGVPGPVSGERGAVDHDRAGAQAGQPEPLVAALAAVEHGDLVRRGQPHGVVLDHPGSRGEHRGPGAVAGPQPGRPHRRDARGAGPQHHHRVRAQPQRPPQPGDLRRASGWSRRRAPAAAPASGAAPCARSQASSGSPSTAPPAMPCATPSDVHVRDRRDRSGIGLGRMVDVGPHALPTLLPPGIPRRTPAISTACRVADVTARRGGPLRLEPCCPARSTGSTAGSCSSTRPRCPTIRTVAVDDVDALVDAIRRLVVRGAPALGVAGRARGGAGRRTAAPTSPRPPSASPPPGPPPSTSPSASAARSPPPPTGPTPCSPRRWPCGTRTSRPATPSATAAPRCSPSSAARAPLRLSTHCNAGALACVEWGTALGVVAVAARRGPGGAGRGRRDAPAPAGRPDHRGRARGAGHRAPRGRRRRRAFGHRARPRGRGRGRRRPGGRQRRRRQQDRHLPAGPGRRPGGHPVRRGLPGVHSGPRHPGRRRRSRSRTAPRTRCSRAARRGTRRST